MRLFEVPERDHSLVIVSIPCALVLVWAYLVREELYLTPESGIGYVLGITGLFFMTLLLSYSARKRVAFMGSWGPIRRWFSIHMALGILGPVAVLLHCSFRLGSINANVALFCVLAVAASGVVGRFLYAGIHAGLFGRRLTLLDLRSDLETSRSGLGQAVALEPDLRQSISSLEAFALAPAGLLRCTLRAGAFPGRARRVRRLWRDLAERTSGNQAKSASRTLRFHEVDHELDRHLHVIRRVTWVTVYERLFALWHAVHLPLCLLLFAAAAVHVVAVHMY